MLPYIYRMAAVSSGPDNISFSLIKLQRLAASFEMLRGPRPASASHERTMLRIAAQLGDSAVGLCARKLGSAPDDDAAHWAYSLLAHIAGEPERRPRVVAALRELASRSDGVDSRKVLALALLTELGEALPSIHLHDLASTHEESLRDLARCLDTPAAVARAANLLLERLDGEDLIELIESMTVAEPRRAATVIDEILLHDQLEPWIGDELKRLRAPLGAGLSPVAAAGEPPVELAIGHSPSGAVLLVASQRRRGARPPRKRALCCSIDEDGALADALYGDDFTPRGVEREVMRPLEDDGYQFEPIEAAAAADLLTAAVRATRQRGRPLVAAYYLGRDLFGLYDQHVLRRAAGPDKLAPLLARAVDLMAEESFEDARPLLERYVVRVPDQAEGWAQLGLCQLHDGDLFAACLNLGRAARLDPDNPLHHWNLGAATHRAGRLGGCYLALSAYLAGCDADPAAIEERRGVALALTREYERFAALEFPGVDPLALARAEELGHRAREELSDGHSDDRVAALEAAVRMVPSHYPSWSELGAAYAARDRLADAQRCLEQALALRPGFHAALETLQQVVERRATATRRPARQPRRRRAKP